jgi:hypothetical protein
MERVHYRRVSPSRINGDYIREPRARFGESENEEPTTVETTIMQSIVSGIIIIFVLLVCLINIKPTAALRDGLRQMLSGAETAGELVAAVQNLNAGNIENFVEEFSYEPLPPIPPTENSSNNTSSYELFDLNIPLTAEGEILNPQIPVPLAVPELWD